ncbi:MAG: hypothetical protein D6710_07045 [Nitrospirae bacterium]|nr:MAG: hypothetical protein D6710_07045 [Nitrospirota bacterium]
MRLRGFVFINLIILILVFLIPANTCSVRKVRVGVVFSSSIPYYEELHRLFLKNLKNSLSGVEPEFILQKPNPDPLAWSNAIRKLLVYDSEVLILYGSGALNSALMEDVDVPVLFAGLHEVKLKKKKNNISGVFTSIHLSSVLRYMKELKRISHLDIVFSEIEPSSRAEAEELKGLCKEFSLNCSLHGISDYESLGRYSKDVRADGVFLSESALIEKYLPEYLSGFISKRIPLVSTMPGLENSTVFTLKPDIVSEAGELSRLFIDTIKKTKTTNRIVRVKKSRLTFNFGLAKSLNTALPTRLISSADEVIK